MNSRLIDTLVDDLECDIESDMCGHFFDLEVLDLNLDSRLDVLMTINSGVYGQLVVYEIPDDFRYITSRRSSVLHKTFYCHVTDNLN